MLKYNISVSQLPTHLPFNTVIILDTETTGLDKMVDQPFMCLIRIIDHGWHGTDYALPWGDALVRWLNHNLPLARQVVCHNGKYDWHMMWNGGVDSNVLYRTNVYCSFVAEALIDEHKFSYGLDSLGLEYFGEGKTTELYELIAIYYGVKPDKKLMSRVADYAAAYTGNWRNVADYGIQDLELTAHLWDYQKQHIIRQDLGRVLDLEMDTLKALVEIERRGVPVDKEQVERTSDELQKRQFLVQKGIIKEVGWEVNSRSPLQMEKAFNKLGLPITYLKSGNPTFAKDVISNLDHPFLSLLQESRNIKTMLDTFIGGSIGKNMVNGRIHTDFNQVRGDDYGTGTGRLSSSHPNLQQIPKRDGELAPLIRSLFCAPQGQLWISNDWEQFEFRVFAHYVKDIDLTNRYIQDPTTDFHTALAEMTGKPRDKAKRINLGLVFGMGEGKLAKELGLPYELGEYKGKEILVAGPEALALFNEYHTRFPRAKAFLKEASHLAKTRGYVKTIMGRRLRFPNGEFVHKAGGLIFQGTSADIMKKKLCELNNEFRNSSIEFNLIVHDEFCLCAPADITEGVAKRVKEITEDVPELRVPILADPGIGQNWWDACQ
jgi:DNA polymerase I-like protein with 3'-5' exonuclease and polymerase domains